jgi:hypothetical protein
MSTLFTPHLGKTWAKSVRESVVQSLSSIAQVVAVPLPSPAASRVPLGYRLRQSEPALQPADLRICARARCRRPLGYWANEMQRGAPDRHPS